MGATFRNQFPTRKAFLELLFAAYNIAPEPQVEPGDAYGRACNTAALKMANMLYDTLEPATKGHWEGVMLVVRLFAELTCAADPVAYASNETGRGWDGDRHEEEGATIRLPEKK